MCVEKKEKEQLQDIIERALREDIQDGDHTALACIDAQAQNKAQLVAKESGICCGIDVARMVYAILDPSLLFTPLMKDGDAFASGDVLFTVSGSSRSILTGERTALNFMQRMSGIATETAVYVKLIEGTGTQLLDTRKTTPNLRMLEKYAVKVGGGENHRFGLYDMIMIKDNHVDFAGGIAAAIEKVQDYLRSTKKTMKIEIEVRSIDELQQVLKIGNIDRIMLDNFSPAELSEAVKSIRGRYETEASGGITKETIRAYASTGVDFVSIGALTHHIRSVDFSLVSL